MTFHVQVWQDEHGVRWELVRLEEDGGCLVRAGRSSLDLADGDAREGVEVVARFGDLEDARAFLYGEGFLPMT